MLPGTRVRFQVAVRSKHEGSAKPVTGLTVIDTTPGAPAHTVVNNVVTLSPTTQGSYPQSFAIAFDIVHRAREIRIEPLTKSGEHATVVSVAVRDKRSDEIKGGACTTTSTPECRPWTAAAAAGS